MCGEFKAECLTDFPDRFRVDAEVGVSADPDRAIGRITRIASARPFGIHWLLALDGLDTPEDVARVRDHYLTIPWAERRSLPGDRFFMTELVGFDVFEEGIGPIGCVSAFDESPTGGLLVVEARDGESEILVPFSKAFIASVDRETRRIVLRSDTGLLSCDDGESSPEEPDVGGA